MVLHEVKNDHWNSDEEFMPMGMLALIPQDSGEACDALPLPFFAFGDSDEDDTMEEDDFDDMEEDFDDDEEDFEDDSNEDEDDDDDDEDDDDDFDDDFDDDDFDDDFEYDEN